MLIWREPHENSLWEKKYYIKSSIKYTKLNSWFIGPFEIVGKINLVAYKISLAPILSNIHDVFHISLLIKHVSNPSHVLNFSNLHMEYLASNEVIPMRVLGFRAKKLRNRKIKDWQVQWDEYFESFATWEDVDIMKE